MLFHVTITHSQEDCPGRRPDEIPELFGPAERLEAVGNEHLVTSHSVVWGASCILWAEPEHVAYALLEAASLEAVERYIDALTPPGWARRALPVFTLHSQLAAVRQLLAAPANPFAQAPAPVTEPDDNPDTSDTLPFDRRPTPDSGAVTRFGARPTILEGLGSSPPRPDQPEATPRSGVASKPYAPSESSTVILEPKGQRLASLRLVASTGPSQGSVFDVGEAGATLGRLPENSICLTDGRLSRHHARIEFRDGGHWLSDLGSQNGTLVNDRPLTEAHRLQAGDSIELGTTRLTVVLDPDD